MNPILEILSDRLSGMSIASISEKNSIPESLTILTIKEAIRSVAIGVQNPKPVINHLCTSVGMSIEDVTGPKSTYTERLRELVRIRDGNSCRMCGVTWNGVTRKLDVHHLNGLCGKVKYDRVGTDITGLITLCHKCHFSHPEHSIHIKRSNARPLVTFKDINS